MLTLWDMIRQVISPVQKPAAKPAPGRKKVSPKHKNHRPRAKVVVTGADGPRHRGGATGGTVSRQKPAKPSMEERYEAITRRYLAEHGIKVRKWRKAMSGIATQVRYRDGRIARYIESPRPRGPMSMAVFLHEVGHHVIGFNTYKPRCLEEYHAWRYAIEQMESLGLNITDSVRRRMHNSLRYAVHKARRRGIKEIPAELLAYEAPWTAPKRTAGSDKRASRPRAANDAA